MPCHGLSNLQWVVLDLIKQKETGLTERTIKEKIGDFSPGATKSALAILEREGLVEEKEGKFFAK